MMLALLLRYAVLKISSFRKLNCGILYHCKPCSNAFEKISYKHYFGIVTGKPCLTDIFVNEYLTLQL